MKKYLLALVMVLGLGLSAKGIDPFCVKNHGSVLLNDHQWHTLTYAYGTGSDNWFTAKISIRQEESGIAYEFKDANEDAVLNFRLWLYDVFDYWDDDTDLPFFGISNNDDKIKIVKEGSDYVGRFTEENLVPGIDEEEEFIGIDIFK